MSHNNEIIKSLLVDKMFEKCKWAAHDKDGEWYAYQNKPELDYETFCWVSDETPLFLMKGNSNENWDKTLQPINNESNK